MYGVSIGAGPIFCFRAYEAVEDEIFLPLRGNKKGARAPVTIPGRLRTNEVWARRQRRDRQAKPFELHADEQLSQAAA